MNDQVRQYFKNRARLMALATFYENNTPSYDNSFLFIEGVGQGVKIPIIKDDVRFVYLVQYLFRKQGHPESSIPPGWRILATKYALLHPLPLHNYVAKFDDSDQKLKIYDNRKIGRSNRTENHFIAEVGPEMYETYAKSNNKSYDAKKQEISGMSRSPETDEIIAKWWMDENKNCLHLYGKGLPSPQVKIISKGQTSVTLAFRDPSKKRGGYHWLTVRDISINMNEFRERVKSHGFEELLHAGHILRMAPKTWQAIIEPEFKGKGGSVPNEELKQITHPGFNIRRPKLKSMIIKPVKGWKESDVRALIAKKDSDPEVVVNINDEGKGSVVYKGEKIASIYNPLFISPGHQEQENDASQEFGKQYSQDKDFRAIIDSQIRGSVISALKKFSIFSRLKDEDLNQELFNSTFERFLGRTGRISDADWSNWRNLIGVANPRDWRCGKKHIETNSEFANTLCQMIGGSAQTELSKYFGLNKSGGVARTIAFGQGGEVDDSRPDATHRSVQGFDAADKIDAQEINTPEALIDYLRNNRAAINNPSIQEKIKQMASRNPIVAQIAQGLSKLGQNQLPVQQDDEENDDDDYDYEEDDYKPGSKFRQPERSPSYENYSFISYLNKRLNEMEVVWGNDAASAKKLKKGQTLKGGIQVQGAPWTVGKKNNSENDIKIT